MIIFITRIFDLASFGIWISTVIANELKGWRTIQVQLVYVAFLVIAVVFLVSLIESTIFTVEGLLQDLGLIPELLGQTTLM